jgi:hypothetical protein
MGKYLGALLSLVVGVAVVLGVATTLGSLAHPLPPLQVSDQGSSSTDVGTLKHVSLTLQTFPNSPYEDQPWVDAHITGKTDNGTPFPPPGDNQGWVTYWPTTTLVVPAHALVTVTIENYDGPTTLLNPFYSTVQGVVGNTALVDGQPVTKVDPANVSHTFTIHSVVSPSQPWLYVSVPVTAVPDSAKTDAFGMPLQPVVTQFSFITQGPGEYIWQCFDPCGSGFNGFGGPMSTKGYMSGTLTVQ